MFSASVQDGLSLLPQRSRFNPIVYGRGGAHRAGTSGMFGREWALVAAQERTCFSAAGVGGDGGSMNAALADSLFRRFRRADNSA